MSECDALELFRKTVTNERDRNSNIMMFKRTPGLMVPSLCTVIKGKCLSECQILNKVSNFEQRFLRDEKVSVKTLETSMQHTSENSKSGRILGNSKNSQRYLIFCQMSKGGGSPLGHLGTIKPGVL